MKKLSKEAESTILTALNSVADSVNDGDHPDDAIVKAAQGHEIPSGHVNLMVTAYNTGRTSKQREAGATPFDKSAEFDIADPHKIMERLYPTRVKTAAQLHDETVIDDEYSVAPQFARRKQASVAAARKLDWKMVDTPPDLPRDEVAPVKRAFHQNKFDEGRYQECRRELSQARDILSSSFEKLGNYFRSPGSLPFSAVSEAIELHHGGIGRAVLSQVSRIIPENVKEAGDRIPPLIKVNPREAPWDLVATCVKLAADLHTSEEQFIELQAHVSKNAEARLRPFVQGQSKSVVASLSSNNSVIEKDAGFASGAVLSTMFRGIGGGESQQARSDERVSDYLEALDDPDHAEELKRIKIRAQVEDMLANDPIISDFDPEDVVNAYNEIVEISPRSADQLMLMRSILRKYLQSGGDFDPYDIQQNIMGAEEGLRKRDKGIEQPLAPGMMQGSQPTPSYVPGPGHDLQREKDNIKDLTQRNARDIMPSLKPSGMQEEGANPDIFERWAPAGGTTE